MHAEWYQIDAVLMPLVFGVHVRLGFGVLPFIIMQRAVLLVLLHQQRTFVDVHLALWATGTCA